MNRALLILVAVTVIGCSFWSNVAVVAAPSADANPAEDAVANQVSSNAIANQYLDFDNVDSNDVFDDEMVDDQDDMRYDTGGLKLEHEIVDEQADQAASGEERFVAVHVPNSGTVEQLRPDLVALSNMAIAFLPKAFRLHNVTEATREVVNGVRYALLTNTVDAAGAEHVCEIIVLERPWILAGEYDKQRELLHSNCTADDNADAAATDANAANNFNFNPLFVNQGQMDPDLLRNLEAQILPPSKPRATKKPTATKPSPRPFDETVLDEALHLIEADIRPFGQREPEQQQQQPQPIDRDEVDCPNAMNRLEHTEPKLHTHRQQQHIDAIWNVIRMSEAAAAAAAAVVSTTTVPAAQETVTETLSDTQKSFLDAFFGVDTVDDVAVTTEMETTTPDMSTAVVEATGALSLLDDDAGTTAVTTSTSAPIATVTTADASSAESETQDSSTAAAIAPSNSAPQDATALVIATIDADAPQQSEHRDRRQADVNQEDRCHIAGPGLVGGHSPMDLPTANSYLADVLTVESPVRGQTVARLACATQQVVSGALYTLIVQLTDASGESQDCKFKIWSRAWLPDDDTVEIKCDRVSKIRVPIKLNAVASNGGPETQEARRRRDATAGGASAASADAQAILDETVEALRTQHAANVELRRLIDVSGPNADGIRTFTGEFQIAGQPNQLCDLGVMGHDVGDNSHAYTMQCAKMARVYRGRVVRSLLYDLHRSPPPGESHAYHTADTVDWQFHEQFRAFQSQFNRSYRDVHEVTMRQRIFRANLRQIALLNEHEQGTAEYGVTQFADMSATEFGRWTGLRQRTADDANDVRNARAIVPDVPVPRAFDWRDKGAVTVVKNQGSCGSCWAFSVTGNIEGLHAIRTGQLESYSEQELVDCDTVDSGCNGGLPDNAYKAIERLGGLELEQDYPYTAKGQKCTIDRAKVHVRVTGAVDLPANETAMAQWVTVNGPLSIGLNANAMQFYRGGVSHPYRALCQHSKIDHGVLIVGFGQSDYPLFNKTMPYWIVKNSWGPQWGEQGYYRVYRGDNTCGINSLVSSAVLE